MHRFKIFLVAFLLFQLYASAQKLYYPDSVWLHKKPEELRMNALSVDSAVSLRFATTRKQITICALPT